MLNAIVDASLRYKVLVLVFFAAVVLFGIRAFRAVPVDAFPDVTPVQVNVYTESAGLAAEDVEQLLTTPVESALDVTLCGCRLPDVIVDVPAGSIA